jgi:two-component system CheB/CheR fusion protein
MGLAVIVIDRQQHVQIWNGQARELWGLMPDEVEDQHLLSLDFGLPVEQLKRELRTILSGDSEREELIVPATNRRGRSFECRVTVLPLGRDAQAVVGAIIMMEPADETPAAVDGSVTHG